MTFPAKRRRRLPALQRRPDDDGLRRRDPPRSCRVARPAERGQRAGRRRQPRRRPRQHHRGRLPGRRGGARRAEESATLISAPPSRRGSPASGCARRRPAARAAAPMPRAAPAPARPGLGRRDRWRRSSVFGGGFSGRALSLLPRHRRPGGDVALYRGPALQLPLGISLYSKQYSIPVQDATLSEDRQRAVTGHSCAARTTRPPRRRHRAGEGSDRGAAASQPQPPRGRSSKKKSGARLRTGQQAKKQLSARTRELFALIPVALLVTAGFTAVLITNSDQLGNLERLLRRLLPRRLRRHPPRHPGPAARRRPVPVPAGGAAGGVRARDALPPRRGPRPRPGQLVRARARPLLGDDHLPARLRGARALPLPDRDRRDRPADHAALPGGRAVNGAYLAINLGPLTFQPDRAGEDLHRRLPRQLPERAPRGAGGRARARSSASCCRRSSTSGRCWWSGARRWSCWSSSATWAAR